MPGICRQTDIGTGVCSHPVHDPPVSMTGMIINGASTVSAENLAQATVTHLVLGNCGHTGMIVTSSTTSSVENIGGPARVGDIFSGHFEGILVSGTTSTSSS